MKPVHILLLILAGAIGGAVVMKVMQKPQPAPAPVMAQAETPAAAAAPAPASEPAAVQPPAPVAAPEEQAKPAPAPAPERREAPKPQRVRPHAKPVAMARNQAPPVVSAPPPAPEPVKEAPAPQPIPPARAEPEEATPPPPSPAPEPRKVTLNAGLLIPVRLVDGLSTERNAPGDTFTATLDRELTVDGLVIAERGARVEGRVVASDPGGKVKGVASLAVQLTRLHTSDGQRVAIQTETFERHAEQTHRQDAEKVGGGAALGAIIGAIAGGGKGAAIGAGVGGGAGAGGVLLTRGKPVTLPSETRVNFRLRAPTTLTERRG